MFHKVAHIYRDITKQETVQALIIIQGLHVKFESTGAAGTSPATPTISMQLQPTIPLYPTLVTTAPEDFVDIQYHPSQVCNCDKIRFDPNGSWRKGIYDYKLFTGERMWRN